MFLEINELKSISIPAIIDKIINEDDTIFDTVLAESIDTMVGYLKSHYDTEAIFNATGTDRSHSILKHLKRIVKFELYKRKDVTVDENTQNCYDETMTWLHDVSTGTIGANLPIKVCTEEDQCVGDGFFKYGSKAKYETDF